MHALVWGLTGLLLSSADAHAQTASPIKISVGFPPGGSVDIIARRLAQEMPGQGPKPLVDNKPGAGGRIALEALKNSAPDGKSWAVTPGSLLVLYPHVFKDMGMDAFHDLLPVAAVGSSVYALAVGPLVPPSVKTVSDFTAWCKANPQQASYASSGNGSKSHLAGVQMARQAGFEWTHIAYKGGAPAVADLIGGQIAANITILSNVLPHIQSGKLRALATTGSKRSVYLAQVPTFKESGFKDIEAVEVFVVLVPGKTSAAIISQIAQEIQVALNSNEYKEGLTKSFLEPAELVSPAGLRQQIRSEFETWRKIIENTGFKADS
jgi:tripartite-type tricarboxylate transporter receptor subunit TctC